MRSVYRFLWAVGRFRVFTIPLWFWVTVFGAFLMIGVVLIALGVGGCPENSDCYPPYLPS